MVNNPWKTFETDFKKVLMLLDETHNLSKKVIPFKSKRKDLELIEFWDFILRGIEKNGITWYINLKRNDI